MKKNDHLFQLILATVIAFTFTTHAYATAVSSQPGGTPGNNATDSTLTDGATAGESSIMDGVGDLFEGGTDGAAGDTGDTSRAPGESGGAENTVPEQGNPLNESTNGTANDASNGASNGAENGTANGTQNDAQNGTSNNAENDAGNDASGDAEDGMNWTALIIGLLLAAVLVFVLLAIVPRKRTR